MLNFLFCKYIIMGVYFVLRVNVVDTIMGGGKTSAAINYINSTGDEVRFLYITPFLSEVERVIRSCPSKAFKQPESFGTKIRGIKYLFESRENIVSTHQLFSLFDDEIIDLAYNAGYILIMDEVADVVESLRITESDKQIILNNFASVDEDGLLRWYDDSYTGEFDEYKRLCDLGCVGIYQNEAVIWLFPISTFRAFREIYILTYLFSAQIQKYYYDYYGVEYNYLYVKGSSLSEYAFSSDVTYQNNGYAVDYRSLIKVYEGDKLNAIGDLPTSLSVSWYHRNRENYLMDKLKNNCQNYFRNIVKNPSNKNMWTTFKDYRGILSGKGYAKGYLSSNIRATNEYRDRTAVAYLINKYFNPYVKNFFVSRGVVVDEDLYATSELLQFLFRSAIRDGQPIELYIPSSRMRQLLYDWFDYLDEIRENIQVC
jgi:hypothetical protein